jgi:diguanylate cyclase (GGDEF)-like protein
MTLVKQTILMMVIALTVIFLCTFVITVHHSKTYFEEQLQHNTQDTTTALGLIMSKQSSKQMDATTMLLVISAVFDRGYFSSILVRDMDGNVLVKRYLKDYPRAIPVPDWFIQRMHLKNEEASALVMDGWQQKAEVLVRGDATVAYIALWQTTKKLFFLFLLTTLVIIIISAVSIKLMFRPLNRIVQQAKDIGLRNLYTVDKLPKLKELKLLSSAMNSMVTNLQIFFTLQIEEIEQLHVKAYKDSLTGKGNRRYFFQHFNQYLSDENYFLPGFLFLIELSGLVEFNQRHGYQAGDQLIVDVSHFLDELFFSHQVFLVARLDGPSFAVVVIESDKSIMTALLKSIGEKVDELLDHKDNIISCGIGVVRCQFAELPGTLLAKADNLIKAGQTEPKNRYCIEASDLAESLADTEAWRAKIEDAIEKKAFHFYAQPVKSQHAVYHRECFIKLLSGSHEMAARFFFPIVQQYSLGADIDQLVLQEIVKIKSEANFAINLSTCTVGSEEKQDQFLALLKKHSKNSKIILHFEMSESTLTNNMMIAASFIEKLVKLGHVVGLDRVGEHLTSLTYLKKLNVAYIKLDGSLSIAIDKHKLKQDILKRWLGLSKRLGITLIATAVESESQWRALSQLGILYFQGTYIQSPLLLKMD